MIHNILTTEILYIYIVYIYYNMPFNKGKNKRLFEMEILTTK